MKALAEQISDIDGVNVGDEDVPWDARGGESRKGGAGEDDVEREVRAAPLAPDVECEGVDERACEEGALDADCHARGCGRERWQLADGGAKGEAEAGDRDACGEV